MENSIKLQTKKYNTVHRKKSRWQRFVTLMAAIVVFCTTYALILPAITWERQLVCEVKEHTHNESCYKNVTIPESEELICGKEEHIHGDGCWCETKTLICGLEENEAHTHSDECYKTERVLVCTLEEHTHNDECYIKIEEHNEEVLICELPEHEHTDACFDAPPAEDSCYYCGLIEHKHNENCYFEDGTLRCTIPEHEHTLDCESDKNADLETAEVWESTFDDVDLIGNWSNDVLAIAESQLGYCESTKNFEIEGETKKGYTRYGAWYGSPYGDWCAMFCSFCLNYAGVDRDMMPIEASCTHWVDALRDAELYHEADKYDPNPGDLIFFDWDDYDSENIEERSADHIGFVYEIIPATEDEPAKIRTIEGNSSDKVQYVTYDLDNDCIMGYGKLPEMVTVSSEVADGVVSLDALCNIDGSYEWQWQVSDDGETWENITGADSLTYSFEADADNLKGIYHIKGTAETLPQASYLSSDNATTSEESSPNVIVSDAISPLFGTLNANTIQNDSVLLVAGSDFQDPATSYTSSDYAGNGNYSAQTTCIKNILNNIKDAYGNAYGFIAGGDYNFDEIKSSSTKTSKGITSVKQAVTDIFGDINTVFVQGNHDAVNSGTSPSGANDTDNYGVFVMNEDDYRSYPLTSSKWSDGQSEAKAATLANALDAYLLNKVNSGYNKPVFIVSHVPLHFSTRTKANADAIYADDFYNVITKYGDDLNIIFLYGHNHAWGDDDYLGGASVFLTKGDSINIAVHGSQTSYNSLPLNFTYMNYGYTGYYWSKWASSSSQVKYSNADSTLTMAAFVISGNTVTISRWSETGIHQLKSIGAASQGNRGVAEVCSVTTNTYSSPQTVGYTANPDDPVENVTPVEGNSGIMSEWDKLNFAETVTSGEDYNMVASSLRDEIPFMLYDISMEDGATVPEEGVKVYLPADSEMRVFGVENNQLVWHDDAEFVTFDDETYMRFTAYHFSIYGTAGIESGFEFPDITPFTQETKDVYSDNPATVLNDGDKVVVENVQSSGRYLSSTRTNNSDGLQLQNVSKENATIWIVEYSGNRYYLKSGDQYISVTNTNASMTGSRSAYVEYNSSTSSWQIVQNGYYLNNYGGSTTGTRAAGYTQDASQNQGSRWRIYTVTEEPIDYWVKCTSTDDFTTTDTYMIVREDAAQAFGINSSNAATNDAVTITEEGIVENRKFYKISGNGSTEYFTWNFSSISNNTYMIRNAKTTSRYLRISSNTSSYYNNAIVSTSGSANTLLHPSDEVWQIKNGSYYLCYSSGFSRSTSDANSYMSIYKKVEISEVSSTQLAVQKFVPKFNSLVSTNTDFTFRLTYSETGATSNDYTNATPATGSYTLYDYYGAEIGTYTLETTDQTLGTLAGCFKLKAGQTALFTDLDTSKHYFVSEVVSDDIATVGAKVNGTVETATSDTNYHWVPVTFETTNNGVKRSIVEVTNTPREDTPTLDITLQVAGSNENVPADAAFNITVTPENYEPSQHDPLGPIGEITSDELGTYEVFEGDEVIGTGTFYPETPIAMQSGQKLRISGIETGNYIVKEQLGDYADYVLTTLGAIDGGVSMRLGADDNGDVQLIVAHEGHTDISIMNKLQGVYEVTFDYGDGQSITVFTDEEGHIPAPWPSKSRSGMEFQGWRTAPDIVGHDIESEDQADYEFTEDTTLYAHWIPFTVTFKTDAEVTKKLRESTAYDDNENSENVFDIDLTAQIPKTGDEVVIIVIDASSSMYKQCAVCGGIHEGSSKTGETHDTYYQGEVYNGVQQGQEHIDYCSEFTKRFAIAKPQAQLFIENLKNSLDPGQNCYVQIITFDTDAHIIGGAGQTGEEPLNLAIAGNDTTLKNAIRDIPETGSGTNIAAGLKLAYERMTDIVETNNVDHNNCYVALLSDGAPTTNNTTMQSGYGDRSSQYFLYDDEMVTQDFINKWKDIWEATDAETAAKEGRPVHFRWDAERTSEYNNNTSGGSKYFEIHQIIATPYYADMIRDFGGKLYTVTFGKNMDTGSWKTANNYKYVAGTGLDNYDYVRSFSDATVRADIGSAEEMEQALEDFYASIVDSTDVECSGAVVTDPMSDNVEFLYFTDAEGNKLDDEQLVSGSSDTYVYKYDPETRTIKWYPTDTATLSYKVRLKNEQDGFEDWTDSGSGTPYSTNGLTEFSYKIKVGNKPIESKYKTIDVPYVHGWLGELDFTKYGGLSIDTKNPLAGATFTLTHDPNTCPVCQAIKEELLEINSRNGEIYQDQLATIEEFTAVSDDDGIVSFANIPSGHTYTLSETPPDGYIASAEYSVKVEYNEETGNAEVTVTAIGDDSDYWDVDNDGNYTLFNLETGGVVLPESGGIGKVLIYTIGTWLIVVSALLCGFVQRLRRCERRDI